MIIFFSFIFTPTSTTSDQSVTDLPASVCSFIFTVVRSSREYDAGRAVGLRRGPDAVERVGDEEHGDDGDEGRRDHLLVAVVRRRLGVARFPGLFVALGRNSGRSSCCRNCCSKKSGA